MQRTAVCLKVAKQQGETAIALANKLLLMDKTLAVSHVGDDLCIPIIRQPDDAELEKITTALPRFEVATCDFTQKRPVTETLTQALQGKLPAELLEAVPQAFDIIGDIVVIDIPTSLEPYGSLIGEAVMQTHRSVCTVLAKAGDISGVFRVRDYTHLAGEHKTQTIHREFGCSYHVDIAKAYFSPRLSHEHERVAGLVQKGEVVADLFAGVGPFSVLIGKQNPQVNVYAVDLNPDAVELLKVNVKANKVENRVFPLLADARVIAASQLHGVADRVIMNLPETAIDFVDAACNAIKPAGGVAHFYGFVRAPDTVENLQRRFSVLVEQSGRRVEAFVCARSIRETAPFESQIVLDAQIR
ncbi:MAG: class I SAM-dependent methyltransferase family protein [Candidatus Bathyarchaeota archaeon]|nr:class I SAM-dependent methyltransferase family protein [Candidatus Bathyarchaeota archaeon]